MCRVIFRKNGVFNLLFFLKIDVFLLAGVVAMAGRVYAVGGFNSSLRERTVDVYDGARDQWSAVASMQERRSTLGAAVLGDLLYAVGGFNGSIGT